ncbi:hypothetical protein NPS35_19940 [Escherichia coli]|uniref:hypothetical protein n=1 Tax=Escherichia coli TaxID=562 RepID=UPI002111B437|nr:hypothetical protein [Escherichia coli]MCQ6950126.1 hypothetical protein [Escherichia coli]
MVSTGFSISYTSSDILHNPNTPQKTPGSIPNMRISNIDWLKKRIGFIRKLGEQTARQRQIIDLLDNEAGLTEQERKLLHVLATAEKNELQAQENARKQANQKRMEGKTQRRERNHRLFLAAGLLIEAGLVDTKTGELRYPKDNILQKLKAIRLDLETSPDHH